jgi:hypothetical protein
MIEVRVDRSATMRKANVSRPVGDGLYGGRPQERPVFSHTIARQNQESQEEIEVRKLIASTSDVSATATVGSVRTGSLRTSEGDPGEKRVLEGLRRKRLEDSCSATAAYYCEPTG